jgi:hypothetical protein
MIHEKLARRKVERFTDAFFLERYEIMHVLELGKPQR